MKPGVGYKVQSQRSRSQRKNVLRKSGSLNLMTMSEFCPEAEK